jgi:hypothetical protein
LHLSSTVASFWRPRLPRLRRAIGGELLRRHGGGREEDELQLWGRMAVAPPKFGGKNGSMPRILEGKQNKWRELPFLSLTTRARSMFRAFLFRPELPTGPQKAGDGLNSSDELNSKSEGRTRSRGRDWTE